MLKWNMWISKCRKARAVRALHVNWDENNDVEVKEEEGNQTAEV